MYGEFVDDTLYVFKRVSYVKNFVGARWTEADITRFYDEMERAYNVGVRQGYRRAAAEQNSFNEFVARSKRCLSTIAAAIKHLTTTCLLRRTPAGAK